MRRKEDKQIRADVEFEKFLKKIAIERIRIGKDEKLRPMRRLTKAIIRHPLFKTAIAEDLIKADFPDD